ncbi:GatB/YqeY domain-containing protein [Sinomonas gamaensis]|uniref:GatB/YqeY domain-containing protein n=1 Tax=Sinomonas gamaensis TaxID=2565624 RepID=UPI001107D71D
MPVKAQLQQDVVAHMRVGAKLELQTVRNVLGEIETREKSGKTRVELDDAQLTSLLQKEAAKRRETAARDHGAFAGAGFGDERGGQYGLRRLVPAVQRRPLRRAQCLPSRGSGMGPGRDREQRAGA